MDHIPKILHLYWGRNNALTYLQFLTVVSFRKHNPNWTIKVHYPVSTVNTVSWTGKCQKHLITSKDYFDDLDEYKVEKKEINFDSIGFKNSYSEVIKSDYFRYYILYHEGGVWSDFDVLFIKPMESINYNNFLGFGDKNNFKLALSYFNDHYSIGFLMATPKCRFMAMLVNNWKKYINVERYQCLGWEYIKKLYATPKIIREKLKISIVILPEPYYLPITYKRMDHIFTKAKPSLLKHYTVGIHWFNGHSVARDFQNKMVTNEHPKTGTIYPYIQNYLETDNTTSLKK